MTFSTLTLEQTLKAKLSFQNFFSENGMHQLLCPDVSLDSKKRVCAYHHVDYLANQLEKCDAVGFSKEEQDHLFLISNISSRMRRPLREKIGPLSYFQKLTSKSDLESYNEIIKLYQKTMGLNQNLLGTIFPKIKKYTTFFNVEQADCLNFKKPESFEGYLFDIEKTLQTLSTPNAEVFTKDLFFILSILQEFYKDDNWEDHALCRAFILGYLPAVIMDLCIQHFKMEILPLKSNAKSTFFLFEDHDASNFLDLLKLHYPNNVLQSELEEEKFLPLYQNLESIIKLQGRYPFMQPGKASEIIMEVYQLSGWLIAINDGQVNQEMQQEILSRFLLYPSDCEVEIKEAIFEKLKEIKQIANLYLELSSKILNYFSVIN